LDSGQDPRYEIAAEFNRVQSLLSRMLLTIQYAYGSNPTPMHISMKSIYENANIILGLWISLAMLGCQNTSF
jgi:hypothetical protein